MCVMGLPYGPAPYWTLPGNHRQAPHVPGALLLSHGPAKPCPLQTGSHEDSSLTRFASAILGLHGLQGPILPCPQGCQGRFPRVQLLLKHLSGQPAPVRKPGSLARSEAISGRHQQQLLPIPQGHSLPDGPSHRPAPCPAVGHHIVFFFCMRQTDKRGNRRLNVICHNKNSSFIRFHYQ